MIEMIGPTYKDAEGFTKAQYPPRLIPKRLWDNPDHRKDLINAGLRPVNEIMEPAKEEVIRSKVGRPTREAQQLKSAMQDIEDLKALVASLTAPKAEVKTETKSTKPANDADQA